MHVTQGRIWSTLEVCEARSRTCSNAGVSRHGVRLLSKGRTLRRAGHDLRLEYVKFAVVLRTTEACSATPCVSCQRDVRYAPGT